MNARCFKIAIVKCAPMNVENAPGIVVKWLKCKSDRTKILWRYLVSRPIDPPPPSQGMSGRVDLLSGLSA
jgi:hypothetical protein